MSSGREASGPYVTDRRELVAYMEAGCKPPSQWRIGTEHEKFMYRASDYTPLPYDGPAGIRAVLEALSSGGWEPVYEEGRLIALARGAGSVTLEPSGQLEFSGEPLSDLHQTCREMTEHLHQVNLVSDHLGVDHLGIGFQPKWARRQMPWMPKGRYRIMRRYLPRRGGMGLDMMLRTCAIQVNLDYGSEADMVKKYRLALALQPLATALFANSPFAGGRPTGLLSYRAYTWLFTDPDRCGIPRFVFEPDMGFERYVDAVLDVPMFFVRRDGTYLNAAGQSFRDFLAGSLPALPGAYPTLDDWSDHLTTIYWDVRMKRFLEMRGADGGPWRQLCALPAFWVGLLYDSQSLNAASGLAGEWSFDDISLMQREVPRRGLDTRICGRPLRSVAREVLALCREGLGRRPLSQPETEYLAPLELVVEEGRTAAERCLESFEGPWRGTVDPLFRREPED